MEMLSFWLNFHPCLHWKLSFWQLWMVVFQMKVSTKQWHLCFSVGSKAMMLEVPWFFFFIISKTFGSVVFFFPQIIPSTMKYAKAVWLNFALLRNVITTQPGHFDGLMKHLAFLFTIMKMSKLFGPLILPMFVFFCTCGHKQQYGE